LDLNHFLRPTHTTYPHPLKIGVVRRFLFSRERERERESRLEVILSSILLLVGSAKNKVKIFMTEKKLKYFKNYQIY